MLPPLYKALPPEWHHHDIITFRKHFEQKWSRRDKKKLSSSAVIQWVTENQSEERISCISCNLIGWEMRVLDVKGGWVFYSVAEELLPPGCEQKYTHRYLQYIQTELQRPPVRGEGCHSGPILSPPHSNPLKYFSHSFSLEVNFKLPLLPVYFPFTSCLTSNLLLIPISEVDSVLMCWH